MPSLSFVVGPLPLLALLAALLLCSCGTTQNAANPGDIKGETYTLPVRSGSKVRVNIADVRLNGKPQKVEKGSPKAEAIRDGVKDFVALAAKKGGTRRLPGATLDITVDATYDGHLAEAATKGFLTGFFTLGLVGHIAPGKFSYAASNSVSITRSDGARRSFSAASATIEGKYDLNEPGAGTRAIVTAQREADRQCFGQIANDLASSGFLK